MFIKKLFLQHFGKYHKQELELQKGINLIYGPNEAGKTTIKDFIIGMFYGVERQRGLAARTDEYTRREPLDGSGYAGSMELQITNTRYTIERIFRKEQKSVKVYAGDAGRELPLKDGQSLQGTIIDLDKNGYTNTLCISSHGAAYKQELQEEFRQYLMNMNETHAGNLNVKDANAYLNQQKKVLNRKGLENELQVISRNMTELHLQEELELIGQQREELEQKLLRESELNVQTGEWQEPSTQWEADAEEEPAEYRQKKDKKAKHEFLAMSEEEKKRLDPQLRQILNFIKVFMAFGVFALILALIFILPVSTYYKLWLCVIALFIALYLWIMSKLKRFKKKNEPKKTGNTTKQQGNVEQSNRKPVRADAATSKDGRQNNNDAVAILEYSRQLADLQVQENELLRKYAKQQEMQARYDEVKKRMAEVDFELEAIELAQKTIQELSGNIYDQYGPGISRRVSEMVSKITQGAYTDVMLDEQLNIKVRKDGQYLGIEFLSTGTLEQIYLAVRLAVAEEMSQAGMPLLLDDIFGAYDDARLETVLRCLADYRAEQVIVFTANDRLADALDRTDIDYNYIEL